MCACQHKKSLAWRWRLLYGGAMTPKSLIETIGHECVARALGVSLIRVQNAAKARRLPALWYDALCELTGRDLPRELFAFRHARRADDQDTP
jgi:hypothetical protein